MVDTQRVDCGAKGITTKQCLEKGCCYRHSLTPGVPYCYYTLKDAPADKEAEAEQCTVSENKKIDCGWKGVTPDSCRDKGCCYLHSTSHGVPFCFYKKNKQVQECRVPDAMRGDCGFSGVTMQQCVDKGCCYEHPSVAGDGAPFCYFKSSDPSQDNNSAVLPVQTTTSLAAMPPPECSVMGPDRVDCGFDGITPAECFSKGCCYYHTSTVGAPFCFYKAAIVATTTKQASSSVAVLSPTSPAVPSVTSRSSGTPRGTTAVPTHVTSKSSPLPTATLQRPATDSESEVLGSNGNSPSSNKLQAPPGGMFLIAALTAVAATAVLCLAYIMCCRSQREPNNHNEESERLYDPVPEHTRCTRAWPDSEAYQQYYRLFVQKWNTKLWPTAGGRDVPPPRIYAIYELDGEPHINTYKTKQKELDRQPGPKQGSQPGNEKTRFHGARIKCQFEGTPCRDATCSVCRIVEQSNFSNDSIEGEMFFTAGSHSAKGHGLAPGKNPPPKNLEHFIDDDAGNAVFVASVLLGTPQVVTAKTKGRLPAGNHSRIADSSTGVDEIIILDEAQALPRALILFG